MQRQTKVSNFALKISSSFCTWKIFLWHTPCNLNFQMTSRICNWNKSRCYAQIFFIIKLIHSRCRCIFETLPPIFGFPITFKFFLTTRPKCIYRQILLHLFDIIFPSVQSWTMGRNPVNQASFHGPVMLILWKIHNTVCMWLRKLDGNSSCYITLWSRNWDVPTKWRLSWPYDNKTV